MSRNKFPPKPKYDPDTGPVYLYGIHTVRAALDNPLRERKALLATPNALARLTEGGTSLAGMKPVETTPRDLDKLLGADAVHQGVALEVEPVSRFGLKDIERMRLVVVLDQLTDPHNVGAIFRTAAAFDAVAVVTQDRHAPPESGALAKAASGGLEVTPWVRVVNLARALEEIAEAGYWRIGLSGHAEVTLDQALTPGRNALVLGAEGDGMRRNIEEHCDQLAKLPISAQMESLNVSNAAAIALYAATVRRGA
jgi:23S rRNA (guanosine2251-2'-O)-methyltransferase